MPVLLVLHQIRDEKKRTKIHDIIKGRNPISVRLTDSALAIHTGSLPVHVYDLIKDHLDDEDQLYVLPLSRPYTGYGPRAATEWLSNYLM